MKRILVLLILLTAFSGLSQNIVRHVDAEVFKAFIKSDTIVLIDLRTDEEIAKKGKIAGSRQIDFFAKDAEKKIDSLDRSRVYLIYCAGGGRSSECADLMQKKGFLNVINLQKGYDDWKRKGFDVEMKIK